jgi:hypothetical protein
MRDLSLLSGLGRSLQLKDYCNLDSFDLVTNNLYWRRSNQRLTRTGRPMKIKCSTVPSQDARGFPPYLLVDLTLETSAAGIR